MVCVFVCVCRCVSERSLEWGCWDLWIVLHEEEAREGGEFKEASLRRRGKEAR